MKRKKGLKIFGIVFGTFVLVIAIMMISLFVQSGKEMKKLHYNEVNMEEVANGTYEGIAETSLVQATVEVTVADHRIQDIKLIRHNNGMGAKAESILKDMIEDNTYEVDSVSGATMSSEVIKSAVSDALAKGVPKND